MEKRQVRISELSDNISSYVLCSPSEKYILVHPEYFSETDQKYLESLGAKEVKFNTFRRKFVLSENVEIIED